MNEADALDALWIRFAASLDRCPSKCGTPAWRNRLCEYHQGFEDGMDAALEVLVPQQHSHAAPSDLHLPVVFSWECPT